LTFSEIIVIIVVLLERLYPESRILQ